MCARVLRRRNVHQVQQVSSVRDQFPLFLSVAALAAGAAAQIGITTTAASNWRTRRLPAARSVICCVVLFYGGGVAGQGVVDWAVRAGVRHSGRPRLRHRLRWFGRQRRHRPVRWHGHLWRHQPHEQRQLLRHLCDARDERGSLIGRCGRAARRVTTPTASPPMVRRQRRHRLLWHGHLWRHQPHEQRQLRHLCDARDERGGHRLGGASGRLVVGRRLRHRIRWFGRQPRHRPVRWHGHLGATSLTSSGNYDIFVMHVTSAGVIDWAVRAGGSSHDYGVGIAADGSGGSLVTGYFLWHGHLWRHQPHEQRQLRHLCDARDERGGHRLGGASGRLVAKTAATASPPMVRAAASSPASSKTRSPLAPPASRAAATTTSL